MLSSGPVRRRQGTARVLFTGCVVITSRFDDYGRIMFITRYQRLCTSLFRTRLCQILVCPGCWGVAFGAEQFEIVKRVWCRCGSVSNSLALIIPTGEEGMLSVSVTIMMIMAMILFKLMSGKVYIMIVYFLRAFQPLKYGCVCSLFQ